jgi:hypothetical protein
MVKAIEVLFGQLAALAARKLVPRIASPLLLISAGRSVEYGYNVAYARATRPTTEHWNLPDAHHTDAIREHPREYARRVVASFDEALL